MQGNGGRPGNGAPEPAALEAAILRIQGIQAARVVAGPGGRVSEVHVLAGRERGAKQLVRDVQSVILPNFGVDIDYRTVSVVQLDEIAPSVTPSDAPSGSPAGAPAPAPPAPSYESGRPAIVRLASETSSYTTEVRIGIEYGSRERSGSARGPSVSGLRIVAGATVDALEGLIGGSSIEVQSAELMTV